MRALHIGPILTPKAPAHPLIGILGLKARDIVGYSTLQFVVHVPVVLFLVWILNYTF